MLILLTHANHLFADRKQVRKMQPYQPLQTLIAAAVLQKAGFEVAFFDTTFNRDFRSALERYRPDLVAVCEDNFNFLTKMCLRQKRELVFSIARRARDFGMPVIVNGSDANDNAETILPLDSSAGSLASWSQRFSSYAAAGRSTSRARHRWMIERSVMVAAGANRPSRSSVQSRLGIWSTCNRIARHGSRHTGIFR